MAGYFTQYFTLSKPLASIIRKLNATKPGIIRGILKYCKDNQLQCTNGYKLDENLQSLFNINKWDVETIDIHQLHLYLYDVVKVLERYTLTKLEDLKAQYRSCRDKVHIINKKLLQYNKKKQDIIEEVDKEVDIVKVNKKLLQYNKKKLALEDEKEYLIEEINKEYNKKN
jgi:chromatin remodeling complex protein RSC6